MVSVGVDELSVEPNINTLSFSLFGKLSFVGKIGIQSESYRSEEGEFQ